ncbi:MAG: hypothetical protein AB1529_05370 [Candidatus Micrarchaeota archaeon]
MQLTLSMTPQLALEQCLECTIELKLSLEDPFETARRIYGRSRKVVVPVELGDFSVAVRAAIVKESELLRLFEMEKFAGIMARLDEQYLFFNRHLRSPTNVAAILPQLMAFHCLAAIRVPDFGDDTGTIPQYQAILLEMAYARTKLMDPGYGEYESWRPTIERSDFFQRPDWKELVRKTQAWLNAEKGKLVENAENAGFGISQKGEMLKLSGKVAVDPHGRAMTVYRKGFAR